MASGSKQSFDDSPSQELGSSDSPSQDFLLDSPRCSIPWEQDPTASSELLDDAIRLDDNSLPVSHGCSQVPTTQPLGISRRTSEQSWKDFGADYSFSAYQIWSPPYTFPWAEDQSASPKFFDGGISSDSNSLPHVIHKLMVQRIVIKMHFQDNKCRSKALRIAAMAIGVVAVAITGEGRDQVEVVGKEIDSVKLTRAMRKEVVPHASLAVVEEVKPKEDEQQSLVESDATNNGRVVGQDRRNTTGSHSKKKNTDYSKNNTKETLEIQCRNKIGPSLEDIKQQFGNTREDAAKNLGISVSTLKRKRKEMGIARWPSAKKNEGSYKGKEVLSGQGVSSLAQPACTAKCFAPTVPASSSQKRIRVRSQIATQGTTSTEDAMAKVTGRDFPFSSPLFTDFEVQAREVEGNRGESASGEEGLEDEKEEKVEGKLSRGNSRVIEELEEDHDKVMQCAELAENVIDLPANQTSVHHVDIPSLAKEDAVPSELALVPSVTPPKRPPDLANHVSFSGTSPFLSAHLVTVTSADQTVPANFPLQGAVGAASAAVDPACSGQVSNNVTQQPHLHETSMKSQFLGFEVSSKAFPCANPEAIS